MSVYEFALMVLFTLSLNLTPCFPMILEVCKLAYVRFTLAVISSDRPAYYSCPLFVRKSNHHICRSIADILSLLAVAWVFCSSAGTIHVVRRVPREKTSPRQSDNPSQLCNPTSNIHPIPNSHPSKPKVSPTASAPNRNPVACSSVRARSNARHKVGVPEPRAKTACPVITKASFLIIKRHNDPKDVRTVLERTRMRSRWRGVQSDLLLQR